MPTFAENHAHFQTFLREATCPTCHSIRFQSRSLLRHAEVNQRSRFFSSLPKRRFHLACHQYFFVLSPAQRGVPWNSRNPPPLNPPLVSLACVLQGHVNGFHTLCAACMQCWVTLWPCLQPQTEFCCPNAPCYCFRSASFSYITPIYAPAYLFRVLHPRNLFLLPVVFAAILTGSALHAPSLH